MRRRTAFVAGKRLDVALAQVRDGNTRRTAPPARPHRMTPSEMEAVGPAQF